MLASNCLLAQSDSLLVRLATLTPATQELLLILGAFAAVIMAVFFWAVALRRRRHRKGYKRRHRSSVRRRSAAARDEIKRLWRMRQRKRKQKLRRNPTLAETGGLPPIRTAGDAPEAGPTRPNRDDHPPTA